MITEHLEDAFSSVVGPGVKLSIALYHFASPLGSAGDDMKDVGAEITLFCATMRQVRSTFNSPKSFRISTTALHDIHDVLSRGEAIFEKIEVLLNTLRNDDEDVNVYARVQETFRKSKVLMWKESLRSCTAMVQVMLTTMAFAERIASAEKAYSSPAEDDQLRDLMQSLLLAQQSTNARLEKLEDQTVLDEMQYAGSRTPDRLGTGLDRSHRRNRSSRAIFDICGDGTADLLAKGVQRTSVLLNRKLYQEDDFGESQRRTWTSLDDHRQSVAQSNDLLQTWTDQLDPAPPYMLSWHGEYAADAYKLDALHESIKRADEKGDSIAETGSAISHSKPFDLDYAMLPAKMAVSSTEQSGNGPVKKIPAPPATDLSSAKDSIPAKNYLHTAYTVRRALLSEKPAFVVALHDYIPHDDDILTLHQGDLIEVVSQLDSGWWDGIANGTRGWFPSNFCETTSVSDDISRDKSGEPSTEGEEEEEKDSAVQEGEELRRKGRGNGGEKERQRGQGKEHSEVGNRVPVTVSPSIDSAKPSARGFLTATSSELPQSAAPAAPAASLANTKHAQDSPSSVEPFKSFRVSLEDPCWKVLPAALRKYNIAGDRKDYALYILYGDQERSLGAQERPLMIFKELDVQGKKPMFMLRKVATAAGVDTVIRPLRPTQPVPEELGDTTQASSLTIQKRSAEEENDDRFGDNASNRREDLIVVGTNTVAPFWSGSVSTTNDMTVPSLTLGSENQSLLESSSRSPPPSADVVFKSLRVSIDDPCWKVLPEALQKYNLRAEWKSFAMWIVYGDVDRCIKSEEKPLAIFRDLEREGKKPAFMLRKWPTETIRVRRELSDSRQGTSGQSPPTVSAPSPVLGFVRSSSRPRAGSPTPSSPAPTVPSTLADDVRNMIALAKEIASGKEVDFPHRVKALHDFYQGFYQGFGHTQTTHRLKFRKDELLDIFDMSGRWWTARNSTGEIGLVPSNYLILL